MDSSVTCEKCRKAYRPTKEQESFIASARQKGMTFIMLECPCCGRNAAFNPQGADPPREPTPSVTYRCPVSRCAGYVVLVDDKKPFWGCGECGSVWRKLEDLEQAIEEITAKFHYRRKCYRKVKGRWAPAPIDKESSDYEERVEQEQPSRAKKATGCGKAGASSVYAKKSGAKNEELGFIFYPRFFCLQWALSGGTLVSLQEKSIRVRRLGLVPVA